MVAIFFVGQSFVFGNVTSLAACLAMFFLIGTLSGGNLFVGQSFVLDIFLFGNHFW